MPGTQVEESDHAIEVSSGEWTYSGTRWTSMDAIWEAAKGRPVLFRKATPAEREHLRAKWESKQPCS